MKNLTLLLAGICCHCSLQAQPTISSTEFITRYSDSMNVTTASTFNPGPAGANVTWDFTTLPAPQTINIIAVGDCPGDPICTSFPTANSFNHVQNVSQTVGSYSVSKKVAQIMEIIGGQNQSDPAFNYTDNKTTFEFPITYNQTYTDHYAIASIGNKGWQSFKVDGYGTLKTPTGTYTDVLRVKIDGYDTTVTGSGMVASKIIGYTWVKANYPKGIMAVMGGNLLLPVPQPLQYAIAYSRTNPATVSVGNAQVVASDIQIFPNPAADVVNISYSGNNATAFITDMTGKVLYTQNVSSANTQLDVSNLPTGQYIIKVSGKENRGLSKLISVLH